MSSTRALPLESQVKTLQNRSEASEVFYNSIHRNNLEKDENSGRQSFGASGGGILQIDPFSRPERSRNDSSDSDGGSSRKTGKAECKKM